METPQSGSSRLNAVQKRFSWLKSGSKAALAAQKLFKILYKSKTKIITVYNSSAASRQCRYIIIKIGFCCMLPEPR